MEPKTSKTKKRIRKFIFWLIVILILLFIIFYLSHQGEYCGADAYFSWLCEWIARIYNFLREIFSGLVGQVNNSQPSRNGSHAHKYHADNQSVGWTGSGVESDIKLFFLALFVFGILIWLFRALWLRFRKYMYPIMVVDVALYFIHGLLCDLETWVGKDYFYSLKDYFYIFASDFVVNACCIQILIISRKMKNNQALTLRNLFFIFLWTILGWAMGYFESMYIDYQSILKESVFFNNILYVAVVIVMTFSLFFPICLWDFLAIRQKYLDKYLSKH